MSTVTRRPGASRPRLACALAVGLGVVSLAGSSLSSAAVPASFVDEHVADVPSPTALAFTPDGRILVTTQPGHLRVIAANGTLVSTPAISFGSSICTNSERGLLGVAVDPQFASNGHIYLYMTRNKSGRCVNRVSRYTLSAANTVAPTSELVLIDEIHSTAGNHNGGDLHIGKDGYLYVSVGDGGCDYIGGNCAGSNDAARDQNVLLGKILRVGLDGSIPPTNPWRGADSARCNVTGSTDPGKKCQETFAWGLRNPFRLAFDPNASGTKFHINDVGQGVWEEIDLGTAGADYGWNSREGFCANGSATNCGPPPAGMTNPIFAYGRSEGCTSITGGAFVPNGVWPSAYEGTYLYGDYVCGRIFQLVPNGSGGFTSTEFAHSLGGLVHMLFGPHGATQALYYTTYSSGGEIRRIVYTGSANRTPTAVIAGSPTSGPVPLAVAFDGSASSDPDPGTTLRYLWDFGDGTPVLETTSATASHTYSAPGTYTANLRVRDQVGATSAPSTLRIDVGNTPPQPTIQTPAAGQLFRVGESVTLRGSATDAEDGTVPATRLSWEVRQHHNTHWHPFLQPTAGNDIPITTPQPEDLLAATNSYLEIRLTATDSSGLSTTVTRRFDPRKVDVTFRTTPAGLRVTANASPLTGPATIVSWDAYRLNVDAPPQVAGGQSWRWQSWSDGGAAAHTIVTPAAPATYTATFEAAPSDLVAAYNFDAGAGTTAADLSGNGNTAVLSGAAWTPSGKNAGAISFDGTNDWLTIADAPSLDLTSGMTLEAWVRPTGGSAWRTVILKERPGGLAYGLYARSDGPGPSGDAWIGGVEERALASATLPSSTWTHLAVTYDGANVRLYVGGALVDTEAATGLITTSSGALRIGGNNVWPEWFAGRIDDVRVYDRALSAAEIQSDRDTPVGAPAALDTTLDPVPNGTTAANVAEFTFSSSTPGATFECRRPGDDWAACVSPHLEPLLPGETSFEVRALDGATPDSTPARSDLRVVQPFLFDSDLDRKAEVAAWRPANGSWHRPGQPTAFFGLQGDVPVPGQWDTDPGAELAVFRPSSGGWYRQGQATVFFGARGDIPVPADWNGDGVLEPTVFRPANGGWYRLGLPTLYWGRAGDIPLVGQWDADGAPDAAVFRPSTGGWYRQGQATLFLGRSGDVPVPADWDGDGRLDLGVWRPETGGWYRPGVATTVFGEQGDIPVLGDWDADPQPDLAVWRPEDGGWYRLGQATIHFGAPTDVP
jgi:glucose/arabinose dehydrogenase/PKD repeat protein